jgi:hypothetical protein
MSKFEASDRVGGRIKTDVVDGFRLIGFSGFTYFIQRQKMLLDYDLAT